MGTYGVLILLFVGVLWWYNHWRQKRLDADPGQHHLSSLLIAAALGRNGVTAGQVAEHLAKISKGGADRRVRLTHAVMLVRSEAAPDLYAKVLNLSRTL
ncbi:MAG: hypothetical protein KGZ65_14215 [Sphingomonadales bacterium]|nr:hypothetical protein [Sphingomonadaceae bacterium]MBS3932382.1 hypothetical protein [Sphingomonadales bacterium]